MGYLIWYHCRFSYLNLALLLTSCCVKGEAATARLDDTSWRRTIRPLHPLLHRLRRTSLKLLQKTVYLCFYTSRGVGHRFHRNTENKHNTNLPFTTFFVYNVVSLFSNRNPYLRTFKIVSYCIIHRHFLSN